MKCKSCCKKALRSEEGIQAMKARLEEAKLMRLKVKMEKEDVTLNEALNDKKSAKNQVAYKVTGDYSKLRGEPGPEWVLDCGCSFEMACWGFFTWKNWWTQNSNDRTLELMPPIPVHPREGVFQNLSRFICFRIDDLMNWRGTGFWDPSFQIKMRKVQVNRLLALIDELEEWQESKKVAYAGRAPGWANVKSRINVCETLDLRRRRV
ncbi:hypothetical protein BDN72DRAFT_904612 [Pluteus cervinus]|uniref:Uncharacterized protein n=1 Tax=Pluteus cervinus TaxID=181527 RepID=A0ACD3A5D9_9AGAR|nr:hypothetical protein BDN72DRAFT_904612 [Pluteus cervinus]